MVKSEPNESGVTTKTKTAILNKEKQNSECKGAKTLHYAQKNKSLVSGDNQLWERYYKEHLLHKIYEAMPL